MVDEQDPYLERPGGSPQHRHHLAPGADDTRAIVEQLAENSSESQLAEAILGTLENYASLKIAADTGNLDRFKWMIAAQKNPEALKLLLERRFTASQSRNFTFQLQNWWSEAVESAIGTGQYLRRELLSIARGDGGSEANLIDWLSGMENPEYFVTTVASKLKTDQMRRLYKWWHAKKEAIASEAQERSGRY